jgi:glycosyltransferase involved in cell wall biosynthesis
MAASSVVMGLLFFPRGGSAQVTRYLARALQHSGRTVSLVTGSLGAPGAETHAATFFAGLDEHYLDYTEAVSAFEAGDSAVAAPVPMHPSYEDREGAPDPHFAAVDPALADHLSSVWEAPFAVAGADAADVFHLHHLTPQFDAVAQRWPNVPLVAHLHGTEIKFVEGVEARLALARALDVDLAHMADTSAHEVDISRLDEQQVELVRSTRWSQWRHGEFWCDRLRAWARAADHVVVVSARDRASAISLFDLAEHEVTVVPNGVDTHRFRPRHLDPDARRELFRRWLVDQPQGWDESCVPGSVNYRAADLDRLLDPDGETTVLLFIGRFTAAKRVPLLLRAFARARARSRAPMSLLIWGGHPGEWEGEHPVTVARASGMDGVFFAGWRGHDDLPLALAASDAVVLPSVNDSYPQAPLEAMAAARPVIATSSGGFPMMVNLDANRPTGWLVRPDDIDALADTLVDAVRDRGELARRGLAARAEAESKFSWTRRAVAFEHAYAMAEEHRRMASRS